MNRRKWISTRWVCSGDATSISAWHRLAAKVLSIPTARIRGDADRLHGVISGRWGFRKHLPHRLFLFLEANRKQSSQRPQERRKAPSLAHSSRFRNIAPDAKIMRFPTISSKRPENTGFWRISISWRYTHEYRKYYTKSTHEKCGTTHKRR